MRHLFAPMEGITDRIFREIHHRCFPGVDSYYTPFFSPTCHRALTPKESRQLPPAGALDAAVVPQLLTKNAVDFLWMAAVCRDLGYEQINLNLGCPSGTVVAKGKGAGMLADLDGLRRFLDEIFAQPPLPISIKTRLGLKSADEFPRLLEIFNQYPVAELILHPRVRSDFYNGSVDMDAFRYCYANSRAPVCFNGNVTTHAGLARIEADFPRLSGVMLGRAMVGNPGFFTPGGATVDALEGFLNQLLDAYLTAFGGSRNAMFRMKEHWHCMLALFAGSEKLGKQLRKATDLETYRSITHAILHTLPMRAELEADW